MHFKQARSHSANRFRRRLIAVVVPVLAASVLAGSPAMADTGPKAASCAVNMSWEGAKAQVDNCTGGWPGWSYIHADRNYLKSHLHLYFSNGTAWTQTEYYGGDGARSHGNRIVNATLCNVSGDRYSCGRTVYF